MTTDIRKFEKVWDRYYTENVEGVGSGFGSIPESTIFYRGVVENFLRLNKPRKVIDIGCGDWQFSKLIPWSEYGILYTGVDVSPLIIRSNIERYKSDNVDFLVITNPLDLLQLGHFDLALSKDVLQHCPNSVVVEYLSVLPKVAKLALLTNDEVPAEGLNSDIEIGGWRPIDIRKEPFNQDSCVLYEYSNFWGRRYWVKRLHLLKYNSI